MSAQTEVSVVLPLFQRLRRGFWHVRNSRLFYFRKKENRDVTELLLFTFFHGRRERFTGEEGSVSRPLYDFCFLGRELLDRSLRRCILRFWM